MLFGVEIIKWGFVCESLLFVNLLFYCMGFLEICWGLVENMFKVCFRKVLSCVGFGIIGSGFDLYLLSLV